MKINRFYIISKLLIIVIIFCGNNFSMNAKTNDFDFKTAFEIAGTTDTPGKNQVPNPTDGQYGYNTPGDGQVSFVMGKSEDDDGKGRRSVGVFLTRVTIYNKNTNAIAYNNTTYYMEGNSVAIPTFLAYGDYVIEVEYEGEVFRGEFSHSY